MEENNKSYKVRRDSGEKERSYKKIYYFIIPLALLIGFVGYWQITSIRSEEIKYKTEKVKENTLEIKALGSGTIIASEKSEIKSEVNGIVEEILVSEGDQVEKDKELLKIKNDKLEAEKAARWADYLKTIDDLEKTKAKPDKPQSEIDSGEANKRSAWLKYKLAESTVDKKIIKSPIKGTIAELNVKVGDLINTVREIEKDDAEIEITKEKGASLITIIDLENLKAEIAINEKDLPKISENQAVALNLDALGKDEVLKGRVIDIDNIGNENKGLVTYNLDIAIEDLKESNIKPGMSVKAAININKEENVLLVPSKALKKEGDRYYVEVLKNETPQKRIVKTGLNNETHTQILDGLKIGEEVIVGTGNKENKNLLEIINNF